jgi:hypothetical protein
MGNEAFEPKQVEMAGAEAELVVREQPEGAPERPAPQPPIGAGVTTPLGTLDPGGMGLHFGMFVKVSRARAAAARGPARSVLKARGQEVDIWSRDRAAP